MPFIIYATEDGSSAGCDPLLICSHAHSAVPPHPAGKEWRWLVTSSEEPRNALVGRRLLRSLLRDGYVIVPLPLESVLRIRSRAVVEGLPALQ